MALVIVKPKFKILGCESREIPPTGIRSRKRDVIKINDGNEVGYLKILTWNGNFKLIYPNPKDPKLSSVQMTDVVRKSLRFCLCVLFAHPFVCVPH